MHVRSPLAIALAALLAAPAAASAAQPPAKQGSSAKAAPAAPSSAPASGAQPFTLGGWVGYEAGDLDGIQLRVEGELPLQKLSPKAGLSLVGALGWSHLSESAPLVDVSAEVLKIVPAARFTMPVNPQLTFFGDAGLGLYWASLSSETDFGPPLGVISADDSFFGLMLRFAVGGTITLNPRTNLGVQLVLDPMFGDYDDTTFSILGGVTYRL